MSLWLGQLGNHASRMTINLIGWLVGRQHKARENVHARATIGFGFTSDWLKKWRENFEPITE